MVNAPCPLIAKPGTIIVLNGTSSAGKTSLATALQDALLPTPYLSLGFDLFMAMLPAGSDRLKDVLAPVTLHAIRHMAAGGDQSPGPDRSRGPAPCGPDGIQSE